MEMTDNLDMNMGIATAIVNTPMQSTPDAGTAVRLWQPSSKYNYEDDKKDFATLSPPTQANLLLFPPPVIPPAVIDYLDAEAHVHRLGRQIIQLRKTLRLVAVREPSETPMGVSSTSLLERLMGPASLDETTDRKSVV